MRRILLALTMVAVTATMILLASTLPVLAQDGSTDAGPLDVAIGTPEEVQPLDVAIGTPEEVQQSTEPIDLGQIGGGFGGGGGGGCPDVEEFCHLMQN